MAEDWLLRIDISNVGELLHPEYIIMYGRGYNLSSVVRVTGIWNLQELPDYFARQLVID